jgi:hypothetical protein
MDDNDEEQSKGGSPRPFHLCSEALRMAELAVSSSSYLYDCFHDGTFLAAGVLPLNEILW